MTVARPAEHGPRFEAMMAEIDFKLTHDGVDIPSRPILAVREVSLRYKLDMPLGGGDPARLPPNLRQNAALSDAIDRWYKANYGDRLKEDPCPARMAVLLDGDLYTLRVPRIFGSVTFVVSRQWLDNPGISRGQATANIVQLIDGMTSAKAARLSDAALDTIGSAFETVVMAAYTLEGTNHPLAAIALGDAGVAVEALMARSGRYGDAKWASLQVAEKVLKAAIDRAGAVPKPTHNLTTLANALTATGLVFEASAQIAAIQCTPGIRYGDEPCSRDEALAAQQAAYELINILREAGANLALPIGGLTRTGSPRGL